MAPALSKKPTGEALQGKVEPSKGNLAAAGDLRSPGPAGVKIESFYKAIQLPDEAWDAGIPLWERRAGTAAACRQNNIFIGARRGI